MKTGSNSVFAFGLLLVFITPGALNAQLVDALQAPPGTKPRKTDHTQRLVIRPAAAPQPALKYRLLPGVADQQPGNAAVWYGKVTAEQNLLFSSRETWQNISEWTKSPLDELRSNEEARKVISNDAVYFHLSRGARCESCDWQMLLRSEPFYTMLLPEAQQTRQFARWLCLRARKQIADGDFEGALHTLQTGFMLARHVAVGPTLINGLVGLAISHMTFDQLFELIQAPGSPNMYWALAILPDPLVDMRPGCAAELDALYLSHPPLKDLSEPSHSGEFWMAEVEAILKTLKLLGEVENLESAESAVAKGFPIARQKLLAQGWSEEKLAAMSQPQVYLLYSVRSFETSRDEIFKWMYLPFPVAAPKMEAAQQAVRSLDDDPRVFPLAKSLLPAFEAVLRARTMRKRELVSCQVVEALRMHLAENDGVLPATLAEITCAPVPPDPATGKAMQYELTDGVAVLSGPPIFRMPFRVEIRLAE